MGRLNYLPLHGLLLPLLASFAHLFSCMWTDEGGLDEGRQGNVMSPFMGEVRFLFSYLNSERVCLLGLRVWVAKKSFEQRRVILSVIIFVRRGGAQHLKQAAETIIWRRK